MNPIDDLIKRVKKFESKINEYIRLEIIEDEPYICDMNSEDQLYEKGITRSGERISDYAPYTASTVEIKLAKRQPIDRVTLRDTGDFHSSFFLVVEPDKFTIDASNWKTEKLKRLYGEEILGLTDENMNELIWEYIYPMLIEKARQI